MGFKFDLMGFTDCGECWEGKCVLDYWEVAKALTLDGQDWEAIAGDEAWGAAVLHKEMSTLEEPPGQSRDKGQATEAPLLVS